ncbi:MAG: hypothetical protein A3F82_00450 [Deltaproteobacteria bacterium RIFCSPLOWO2_12_FULL_44_12]|nr:MAG: hypothetical protein A3D98_08515 [Deltaproteobacteria bacterium RIFCSPHIGHO2_12_FULL_44_21]OGQ42061.1 MAG: hypothetical protein A3I70_10190 [Deltaproteobacteria bacterium RIFCSPLOWO2_02_FULL_44_34]OGQ71469.1 MAG: hypothetical protein A3F82_00450 [Deltaproteobacteria bacterium RIFCSPLOWO2_12_FULL_44_12]
MFEEGNFLHRHIINRTVPSIRLDEANLENVKSKAGQGTLIYISVNLGQLEHNVFNSLYLNHGLPLAHFNNCLKTRHWLPLPLIRKSYRDRVRFFSQYGELPHPLLSGYLKNLCLEEKSSLISLDAADPSYLSMAMRDIFNVLLETQKSAEKPIFLVPQQLIWDKRPKREKASFFEALFGETEHPGPLRKLILFFRHYRKRAIVKFGEPIPLQDFLGETQSDIPLKLYQKILGSLQIEKRTLTGPPIRARHWFLDRIFEDTELSKILYQIAKEKNKPLHSVKRLAQRYAKEIVADLNYSYVEFAAAFLNWFFKTFFEGVLVDPEGLKNLKRTLQKGPTILVPNHRSHLDYLLMGYLCYSNDIVNPYVAAGINMAFWPMGFYFRRSGAFFLRRTFSGNIVYKNVFQTYLKVLIQEGYLQEFFIEGGRSRTGKLRTPKLGMLSMYSQAMQEGAAPDVQFMPVSITYDRVMEQKSYLAEVEGKPKQKEKTRDLLKLRKFLKGRYGKIYVHFDEPISWQQTAAEISESNWEIKKPKLVEMLSQKITHAINRQVVVIPQSLTASSLLLSAKKGIPLEKVESNYVELLNYLQWKQVKLADTLLKNPNGAFYEAMHQFESAGLIKKHQGLEQAFYEIPTDKRLELDFFKNISIHYFVSLSLWSGLLLSRKAEPLSLIKLSEEYLYFQQLFLYEFRFSTRRPIAEHLDKLCCYLQERKLIEYAAGHIKILEDGKPLLQDFSMLLKNYIEAYYVAWQTYLLRPMLPNEQKALTKSMLAHGKHLLMLGEIEHPEAISQTIFENAILAFKSLNLFEADSNAAKKLERELERLLAIYRI